VYPVKISIPFENSPLNSYVTALHLLDPVDNAFISGRARQLTFPSGRLSTSLLDPNLIEWQEDIQPAVSPDGQKVAYVRLRSALTRPVGQRAFDTVSIRIVSLDGSSDREVIAFQQGSYVSHVSWTADGTGLVFDGGLQASTQSGPLPMVAAGTVELYTVRIDGTGFSRLRGVSAVWPACWPGDASGNPPPPEMLLTAQPRLVNGISEAVVSWPVSASNAVLEVTDLLGPLAEWRPVIASPAQSDTEQTVVIRAASPSRFYRLRTP
jgi:hypothetical protein